MGRIPRREAQTEPLGLSMKSCTACFFEKALLPEALIRNLTSLTLKPKILSFKRGPKA